MEKSVSNLTTNPNLYIITYEFSFIGKFSIVYGFITYEFYLRILPMDKSVGNYIWIQIHK